MASIFDSLQVLADPTRLRILALLDRGELSVAELQEILAMGQSRISSHLARLKAAGLASDRKAGKHTFYNVADPGKTGGPWRQLRELALQACAELPETAKDRQGLGVALRRRQDAARDYFNQLAGRFSRSYCPGRTWRGLAHLLLGLVPRLTIADFGAGEGTLSQLLARRAERVIAIDNSEKMVAFGRETARKHGIRNLEFRLGDIENPPIKPGSVDVAIFSQALHHASDPGRALAAAGRALKPGGRVAVLDLLHHEFEQARELYADLWLGFSEAELDDLLKAAGFGEIAIAVVAREKNPPHFQTLLATATKPK